MLSKLLKYEFKSTARILLPLYIFTILYSGLCRLSAMLTSNLKILETPTVLLYVFYFILIIAIIVITAIVILQQFYKNLLGDEGYLMFTIPVEPHKHIITKLITSFTWILSSIIVALGSMIILILDPAIISAIKEVLSEVPSEIWSMLWYALVIALFQSITSILMIYTAISLGQLVTGHKIVGSIVSYLALYIINQIIMTIVMLILGYSYSGMLDDTMALLNSNLMPTLTIVISVINIGLGTAYFFVTNYIFKNKLNLE